jgi:citrate lyase synthetase
LQRYFAGVQHRFEAVLPVPLRHDRLARIEIQVEIFIVASSDNELAARQLAGRNLDAVCVSEESCRVSGVFVGSLVSMTLLALEPHLLLLMPMMLAASRIRICW